MTINYISNLSNTPRIPIRDPDDAPGFSPDPSARPHLEYRGGKVLQNPSIVSMYYGSYWNTNAGKADAQYENSFAKYLGSSRYTSLWAQYGVGKGSFAGSTTIDTKSTPKSVNDLALRQIISQQIASGTVPKPDGKTVYTVFLPPNAVLKAPGDVNSRQGLGGYHGSFDLNGKRVYYAAIVYSKGSNGIDFGSSPRDNISIVASHEWTEAATDPDVNNGQLGWYDDNLGEVADIPINQGLDLDEVYGRLGKYAVQKIWSNIDGRNELSAKHPGEVIPPEKSMIREE